MASYTVNAAAVGTALVTGAGTITGITLTQPAAGALNSVRISEPISIIDAAVVPPLGPIHTLFATTLAGLLFVFGIKPTWPLTPGLTAPTWPESLGTMSVPFTNGIFVKSCPVNITLTVTA